ncbi:MAG: DNA methyltransferase [Acidimicrobiales bacterium]
MSLADREPYYSDGAITLYHGDCREVTEWLTADVLITDPPYGMAYISHFSKFGSTTPVAGDSSPALRDAALEMWTGPALVFGTWRIARPAGVNTVLAWDKGNVPGLGDLSIPWGPSWEEVYVIGRQGWTGKRSAGVLRVDTLRSQSPDRPSHPTPKPVPLMELLIAKTVGTIADPFAGSGATLLAARNLGRSAVGVEVEERYCELIATRLEQGALDLGVGA